MKHILITILKLLSLAIFTVMCFGVIFSASNSFLNAEIITKWFWLIFSASIMAMIWPFITNTPTKQYTHYLIQEIDCYIFAIVVACSSQAIYGLMKFYILHHGEWLAGSFDNPAGFAACLCAVLPFIIYFIDKTGNVLFRYLFIIILIVTISAIVLSFSRAGIFQFNNGWIIIAE